MELLVRLVMADVDLSPAEVCDEVQDWLPGRSSPGAPGVQIKEVVALAGGDKVIACDREHFDRVVQAANDRAGGLLSFSKRMTGRASERASAAAEAGAIRNSIEEVKS